jgi:transcriptional regulator with XRE-family HTH domain
MAAHGIQSIDALADKLGLSRATAFRIMGGTQEPSPAFLAGCRSRLGLPFDLAVEVIDTVVRPARGAA